VCFIYLGEARVAGGRVPAFLEAARQLGVEGLVGPEGMSGVGDRRMKKTVELKKDIEEDSKETCKRQVMTAQCNENVNINNVVDQEIPSNVNGDSESKDPQIKSESSIEPDENSSAFCHENMEDTSKESFSCYLCEFTTIHQRSLKRHALVHSGEKPFVCNYCPKTSTQKYDIKLHMEKKHANEQTGKYDTDQF
jgi:hypothetical protein